MSFKLFHDITSGHLCQARCPYCVQKFLNAHKQTDTRDAFHPTTIKLLKGSKN